MRRVVIVLNVRLVCQFDRESLRNWPKRGARRMRSASPGPSWRAQTKIKHVVHFGDHEQPYSSCRCPSSRSSIDGDTFVSAFGLSTEGAISPERKPAKKSRAPAQAIWNARMWGWAGDTERRRANPDVSAPDGAKAFDRRGHTTPGESAHRANPSSHAEERARLSQLLPSGSWGSSDPDAAPDW
jgi:hypothetical protein